MMSIVLYIIRSCLAMGLAQVCATDDIEENKKICLEIIDIAGKKNVQFLFFPEGFYFMGPPESVYNIYIFRKLNQSVLNVNLLEMYVIRQENIQCGYL